MTKTAVIGIFVVFILVMSQVGFALSIEKSSQDDIFDGESKKSIIKKAQDEPVKESKSIKKVAKEPKKEKADKKKEVKESEEDVIVPEEPLIGGGWGDSGGDYKKHIYTWNVYDNDLSELIFQFNIDATAEEYKWNNYIKVRAYNDKNKKIFEEQLVYGNGKTIRGQWAYLESFDNPKDVTYAEVELYAFYGYPTIDTSTLVSFVDHEPVINGGTVLAEGKIDSYYRWDIGRDVTHVYSHLDADVGSNAYIGSDYRLYKFHDTNGFVIHEEKFQTVQNGGSYAEDDVGGIHAEYVWLPEETYVEYVTVHLHSMYGNPRMDMDNSGVSGMPDENLPGTITNLDVESAGTTWIKWTWDNPNDEDFNKVKLYLTKEGGEIEFIGETSDEEYNVTELTPNTEYMLSTNTIDNALNINYTWVNDSATTVQNIKPEVTDVQISPDTAYTNTNLTASGTYSDADNDKEDASLLKWYKNDAEISTGTTLSSNNFVKHDVIVFEYTPYDGWEYGDAVSSSPIMIQNSVPVAVITLPETGDYEEKTDVSFDGSQSSDLDGDNLTHVWVSNIDGEFGTEEVFTTDSLSVGTHEITLTVEDGDGGYSTIAVEITVEYEDNKPQITNIIPVAYAEFYEDEIIEISADVTDDTGVQSVIAEIKKSGVVIAELVLVNTEDDKYSAMYEIPAPLSTYYVTFKATDVHGNKNNAHTHFNVFTKPDTTPPRTITDLTVEVGTDWIEWSWTNPTDSDFDHTEIWIDGNFVTTVFGLNYKAIGLQPDTTYELKTRTVDQEDNINTTWVGLNATTYPANGAVPIVIFTYSPEEPTSQDSILFDARNSYDLDDNMVSAKWDFGDGTIRIGNYFLLNHNYGTPGTYTVTLNITDADGNIGTLSKDIIVVHDSTPPEGLQNLRETATGNDWIVWQWDNPEDYDYEYVEIYIDGVWKENVPANNEYYIATGLQDETLYMISTKTVDGVGNINPLWVNDTAFTGSWYPGAAPEAFFTYVPDEPLNGTTVIFDGSASCDRNGEILNGKDVCVPDTIVSYEWSLGDGATATNIVVTHEYALPGDYLATLKVTDDEGLWDIYSQVVSVRDESGGGGNINDTDAPIITILGPADGTIDTDGIVTFRYRVYDYDSGIANTELIIDGVVVATNNAVQEGVEQTFTAGLFSGSHTWSINATDDSANLNEASSVQRNLQVIMPYGVHLSYPGNLVVGEGANAIYTITVSNIGLMDDTYTLSINNLNGADVATLDVPNITVTAGSSETVTLTVMDASAGTYDVEVTAVSQTDAGITDTITPRTTVSGSGGNVNDTDAPIITILGPADGTVDTDGTVTFTYIVYDLDSGIASTELIIDGVVVQTNNAVSEGVVQTFTATLFSGSHTWSINATDDSANANEASSVPRNLDIVIPYGVYLTYPGDLSVAGGANAVYTITVNNIGLNDDTYTLSINNLNGADVATLDVPNVTVSAGSSATVTLTVMDASAGTYDVEVTAVSQTDAGITDTITPRTTVTTSGGPGPNPYTGPGGANRGTGGPGSTDEYTIEILAKEGDETNPIEIEIGVSASSSDNAFSMKAGETEIVSVSIENIGNTQDVYDVSIMGANWLSLSERSFGIESDGTRTLLLTFSPDADVEPGEYLFTAIVKSKNYDTQSVVVITVTIEEEIAGTGIITGLVTFVGSGAGSMIVGMIVLAGLITVGMWSRLVGKGKNKTSKTKVIIKKLVKKVKK